MGSCRKCVRHCTCSAFAAIKDAGIACTEQSPGLQHRILAAHGNDNLHIWQLRMKAGANAGLLGHVAP